MIKTKVEEDIEVLMEHIPYGRDKAISRSNLRGIMGMCDRDMRNLIHQARSYGQIILSTNKGYYTSNDTEDLKKQYWQEKSRIANTYKNIRYIRAILKERGEKV